MKWYYFTFGQSHIHIDGFEMKDYWVEVKAKDYMAARLLFIKEFSYVFMEAPDKWAFQYTENEFDKTYFPKGCHMSLKQE